jgi:hypothetical protein
LVCVTAGGQASRQLPLYLGVRQHSPAGFNWGSSDNGSAQLARERAKVWEARLA